MNEVIETPPTEASQSENPSAAAIRPEVQALIDRGCVHLDEFPLGMTLEESSALVPALVNSALAMRLRRVLAKLMLATEETELQEIRAMVREAERRIQDEPPVMWPRLNSHKFAALLFAALLKVDRLILPIPLVSRTYREALLLLASETVHRLRHKCR